MSNATIVTDGLVFCVDAASDRSYPNGGTTWSDLMTSTNGDLENGPVFSDVAGGCILFDKTNERIDTNRQIIFDRTDPYTLGAWIYTLDADNNQIINNENASYRGYQFAIDTNNKLFTMFRSTTSDRIHLICDDNFPVNEWKYVVASYDGSSDVSGLRIYIDADEPSTNIGANDLTLTTATTETTYIGLRRPNTPGPFSGYIALAHIYNRALSANEIRQNYLATRGRFA